jgi:O-antigen/teichoic acid export membrane protein
LVATFAWARTEIFFLELAWGSHTVALFAASVTFANLATQGPLLLAGGLLPHLSRQAAAGTGGKLEETYAISILTLAFLIFPACLGTAAIAPTLVPLVYGQDFAGAVPSTTILLCGAAATASSSVAFTYMLAVERTRFALVTGGAAALVVAIVGLTVIPTYGLLAAATARAATQAAVSIATILYLWRVLRCPTPVIALLRLFVAAVMCAIAARACVMLVPGIRGLVLAVGAGALVYAIAVRVLRAMPASQAEPLLNALKILPWPIRIPATTTLRLIAA